MGEIFLALRIILDMLTQSIIHHLNAEKTGEGGNQRKILRKASKNAHLMITHTNM